MVRFFILICFLLLCSTTIFAITIEDIAPFEASDYKYVRICDSSIDEVVVDISCSAKTQMMPWSDMCVMYAFDVSSNDCLSPTVTARIGDVRRSIDLYVLDYTKELEYATEQQNETTPLEIAEKIYAYTLLNNTDGVLRLLETLKEKRNNAEKCWPEKSCTLRETVSVLKYLSDAGIGKENRVYYDALLWVSYHQNNFNEELSVEISSRNSLYDDDKVSCDVLLDKSLVKKVILGENASTVTLDVKYVSDKFLNVTCDERFEVVISSISGDNYLESGGSEDDTVSFRAKQGCFSNRDYTKTRINGVTTYMMNTTCVDGIVDEILLLKHLDAGVHKDGLNWLEEQVAFARITGKKLRFASEILDNIYTYVVTKDSTVKRWILFTQNNDGSFGSDRNLYATLRAIEVFTSLEDKEWRDDAMRWVDEQRTQRGWTPLMNAALGYKIFGATKSSSRTTPQIFSFEDTLSFTVYGNFSNASIKNTVDNSVALSFDIKNQKGTLTRNVQKPGSFTGFVYFSSENGTYTVPYISKKDPRIDVLFDDAYFISNTTGAIHVPTDIFGDVFVCNVTFSELFDPVFITEAQDSIQMEYNTRKEGTFSITATSVCDSTGQISVRNYSFVVRKYSDGVFTIKSSKGPTAKEPGYIIIRNNLKESYALDFVWSDRLKLYEISPGIVLDDKDLKVYLFQKKPHVLPESRESTLTISALGYSEKRDFMQPLLVNPLPHSPSYEYMDNSAVWFYVTLIILFIILGTGGFFGWNYVKHQYEEKKIVLENRAPQFDDEDVPEKEVLQQEPVLDVLTSVDEALHMPKEAMEKEFLADGFSKEAILAKLQSISTKPVATKDAKKDTTKDSEATKKA